MRARTLAAWAGLAALPFTSGSAAAQMPDPRVMSGQIMPSPELPAGTVTVRIIRQSIMNVVPDVDVELHGAGDVRHAKTTADGHAVFSGVPPGSRIHAVAVVDNERLESIEFDMPASGGIRTLLAAGVGVGTMLDGSAPAAPTGASGTAPAAPAAEPAPAGALVFGGDTRFAVEFQDDTLTVFYLLDLVNRAKAPASLDAPLTIDLPTGASGASLLEGGSQLATVKGSRVTIAGPVPPGVTQVPVAFRIEQWKGTWQLAQALPLPLEGVAMAVQKLGDMRLVSPQAPTVQEAPLQGTPFLIASGGPLAAGTPLTLTITGLPHRSDVPIYITLALATLVAAWGVWLASAKRPERGRDSERRRELRATRDRGLDTLAALEADVKAGRLSSSAYAERRAGLLEQLERIYSELDGDDGGVPGGDRGLAA